MFTTTIDVLDTYDGQSLVIVLGDCQIPENIDQGHVISFTNASSETLQAIGSIDVRAFQFGISLVISSELAESEFERVRLIQKHLVFCYVKFVWFPKQDTFTPDPFGMGGDKGPLAGMVYDINKLENLPWLMSGTRTKDIENSLPPTPVLLLAPGPSLLEIAPHLKDLSQRFLVICLSRSLNFCQEHGVTPDIVVQLDTHGEQENFYPSDMDFSKTWLIGLSCAPMAKYLNRFAGVYWIDTFEGNAFDGDPYEMHTSWLSSLIAMMGVANLFSPPKALMVGSDLSFKTSCYYNGSSEGEPGEASLSKADELEAVRMQDEEALNRYDFPIRLNDGSVGTTRLQFLATAFEAESISNQMLDTSQFYNLSNHSILGETYIPYSPPESHLNDPILDRRKLFKVLGLISQAGQHPKERAVQILLKERLQRDEILLREATLMKYSGESPVLQGNPLLSAGKILTNLHSVRKDETKFNLVWNLIRKERALVVKNMLLFRLKGWVSIGKSVPVYCYPHEQADLEAEFTRRFPKGKWEFRQTWSLYGDQMSNRIPVRSVTAHLESEPISLMTRSYADSANYILSVFEFESYLIIEDILESSWPGERV